MKTYEPGINEDLLLLQWYQALALSGDLEKAFSVTLTPCGAFMAEMRRCTLVYETDEDGIWFAAWYEPLMTAGSYGLWARKDRRQSRELLRAGIESLHIGLERYPVLIFATMHEYVMEQSKQFGFVILGTVPYLFDGEPATIGWLDAEHFYPAIAGYAGLFEGEAEGASDG